MLIKVMYKNGTYGMVKPYLLDKLLADNALKSFLRSDDWVVIGRDAIRSHSASQCYDGPERRELYALSSSTRQGLTKRAMSDIAWICCIIALISIMFTRLT